MVPCRERVGCSNTIDLKKLFPILMSMILQKGKKPQWLLPRLGPNLCKNFHAKNLARITSPTFATLQRQLIRKGYYLNRQRLKNNLKFKKHY